VRGLRWVGVALAFGLVAGCGSESGAETDSDSGAASAADDATPTPGADSAAEADSGAEPRRCNGFAALCDRRLDQVAFVTAHNAMSNADEEWVFPNQEHSLTRQLEDGVRGFMLDTHDDGGVATLCHGTCLAGSEPLEAGLGRFAAFVDAHPDEVLVFIFEAYVSGAATAAAFEAAGLGGKMHVQEVGDAWPTLRELLDAGTPLVVFTDRTDGGPAWYMDVWDHAFETRFSNKSPANLQCRAGRGSTASPLFILNHFLTDPVAFPELAEQINFNPYFIDKARECGEAFGRMANFVTVDFYATGDVFAVVDALNGQAGRRRPGADRGR
jgi:hypothetical protein